MKTKINLLVSVLILISSVAFAQTKKSTQSTTAVQMYYAHYTARCVTCKTVESEAKKDLAELYGSKVSFQSINLDEATNDAIAKKLNISTQTLLIVKGAKQVNITNEAFMYARANPAKFKAVIKAKIDAMLK